MKTLYTSLIAFLLFASFSLSVSAKYATDITVALDGSGDYQSIQEAINATKAFPDEPITIHLKNGVYKEKVRVYPWNTQLTLKGESAEKTIITYDDYFDKIGLGRNSTFHTYTLKVEANDFTAENLTIENSSGPVGQAVALHVEGDRCQFINCRILGHQDTLYAAGEGSRQYFSDCLISGTTDFIFGGSIAFFEHCTLHSKANSYVTAASTSQHQPFGYVFSDCQLTADKGVDKVYLGRPWRDYANVVYLNCKMGAHILQEGWSNWSGTQRDQTAFFAEYKSSGQGAKSSRVTWAKTLSDEEAQQYTIENVFRGKNTVSNWNPQQ